MESIRVKHIMESHGVLDVRYENEPVWIEGIRDEIAQVTLINSGKKLDVPVTKLYEA